MPQNEKQTVDSAPTITPKEIIPNFELPLSVVEPIQQANQGIMERFGKDQTPGKQTPNLVLVLERSAVLPSSSIVKKIKTLDQKNIRIVNLPIGKVLPYMFAEAKGQALEAAGSDLDFDETDINLHDSEQAAEFVHWLQNTDDPTVVALLKKIKELKIISGKTLVIDDAKASGETVDLTLPLLLRAVKNREIKLDTETYFPASFSLGKTILENIAISLSPVEINMLTSIIKGQIDIRRFKIELESEFYNIPNEKLEKIKQLIEKKYSAGIALLPLDTELAIEILGYQAMMQVNTLSANKVTENPAAKLLDRFGLAGLLELKTKVQNKFAEI